MGSSPSQQQFSSSTKPLKSNANVDSNITDVSELSVETLENAKDSKHAGKKESLEFNDDDFSEERRNAMQSLAKDLQSFKINRHDRTPSGAITKSQIGYIIKFVEFYFPRGDESRETTKTARSKFTKTILKYDTINIICDYSTEYLTKDVEDEDKDDVLMLLSGTLHNYSDCNPDVCKVILKNNAYIKTWKEKLQLLEKVHIESYEQSRDTISIINIFGILHNVSQVEDLVQDLREVGVMDMVKPYLKSPNDEIRLTALAILANIVNEDESDILTTNNELINLLNSLLLRSMNSPKRCCALGQSSWETTEFALTIRMIARNDNNKKSLVEHGVLPLLVELSKGTNVHEQREAVGALWSLSFDENNRYQMINDEECEAIDAFERLMSTEDNKVRGICRKALWTLREDLVKSSRYRNLGLKFMAIGHDEKDTSNKNVSRHVMISYNRSHRPLVSEIHNHIVKDKVSVWMDVNDMHGSTVDAMAKAVEDAEIVLVCYSPQYKNSDNCRAEAEYAYKLKKKMLFLKMVTDYDPDGWLGFIIGSKKFYDFSGKYPFEQKVSELKKAIRIEYGNDDVDGPNEIKPQTEHVLTAVPILTSNAASPNVYSSQLETVQKWSKQQLEQWLQHNQLSGKAFKNLEGYDVAFLCVMVNECPEYFYQTIREQLGVKDIHTMARLRFALNALNIRL